MIEIWQQIIVSATTLAAALISAIVVMRKHKSEDRAVAVDAANHQVDSIFSVYGQIVSDLRDEVDRLKSELDAVRTEQQICEERNAQLESLVAELVARVQSLEVTAGG